MVSLLGTNPRPLLLRHTLLAARPTAFTDVERDDPDRDGATVALQARRAGPTGAMTSLQPDCWVRTASIRTSPCRFEALRRASTTSPSRAGIRRVQMEGTRPSAISQQTTDPVIRCEANVTLPGGKAYRDHQFSRFVQRHLHGLAGHGQRHHPRGIRTR